MLNSTQKLIIEEISKPVIVTAGPGTGKTNTLVHKVEYLLEKNYDLNSIIVLTFNDKASEEIYDRIKKITSKEIKVRTFHSFSQEIIEENLENLSDISRKYKLIEEADSLFFFHNFFDEFKISSIEIGNRREEIANSLHSSIMRIKEEGIGPKEIDRLNFADLNVKIDLLGIYAKYENYKIKNNFLDFADLLIYSNKLLRENIKIQDETRKKYNYILVDEFQDLNSLQYDLLKLISKNNNLTVVGDPKQAIYSFRGSKTHIWDEFKKDFPTYEEFFLQNNYRSGKKVIDIINSKIVPKNEKLISRGEEEGVVISKICRTQSDQEHFIIEEITTNINSFNNVGVLFRTSNELNSFSKILDKEKISHISIPSKNIFDENIIQEIMQVLKIIDSPEEANVELFSFLENSPIHKETLRKIMNSISFSKNSLYNYLLIEQNYDFLINLEEKKYIRNVIFKFEEIRKLYLSKRLLSFILPEILLFLKSRERTDSTLLISTFESFVLRLENIYEDLKLSLFFKLVNFSKSNFLLNEDYIVNKGIFLLTYHQAKGKEFDVVIMPTLNERRFPIQFRKSFFETPYSISRENFLEEEKKLFFVGISRSRSKIYFSYVERFGDNKNDSKKSVFLEDMGLNFTLYSSNFSAINQRRYDMRKELQEKINRALELDNFSIAKKNIDLLERISKKTKNLSSFLDGQEEMEKIYSNSNTNSKSEPINFDIRKITFSVSQIQTFDSCPKKYLYQYVYRVPTKPRHYFDFGTTMHLVLENLVDEVNKNLDEKKLYEIGLNLLKQKWISKAYESREQEEEYFQKGEKAIKDFISKAIFQKNENRKILEKESRINVELWGKKFVCIIDRIDKVGDEIEIIDYKTSNSMELNSKLQANIQLNVYAQAIKEKLGKYPNKASLWYLIHDKISSINIEQESVELVKEKVLDIISKIEDKKFDPKPNSFSCKYCDFNKICKESMYKS